jgi:putative endonuclease
MSHFLYILFSKSKGKYYVGETHNLTERLLRHNNHTYDNSFTKIANDWEVTLAFECINKTDALYLEGFIKRMKSKIFVEKIILNPEIITDLLSKK